MHVVEDTFDLLSAGGLAEGCGVVGGGDVVCGYGWVWLGLVGCGVLAGVPSFEGLRMALSVGNGEVFRRGGSLVTFSASSGC